MTIRSTLMTRFLILLPLGLGACTDEGARSSDPPASSYSYRSSSESRGSMYRTPSRGSDKERACTLFISLVQKCYELGTPSVSCDVVQATTLDAARQAGLSSEISTLFGQTCMASCEAHKTGVSWYTLRRQLMNTCA